MIRPLFTFILALLISLGSTQVGFAVDFIAHHGNVDENGPDMPADKEADMRAHLRAIYRPIIGLFRGQLLPDAPKAKAIPIELRLILVETPDGVNENQELVFRPEIRGYFTNLALDPNITPIARRPILFRFYEKTNEIAFANWDHANGPVPGVGYVSVSGMISEDLATIEGEAHMIFALPIDGQLKLTRVSS